MGLFNTHIDLNPFNGGFDPTPFLNLGVTTAVKKTTPNFGVVGNKVAVLPPANPTNRSGPTAPRNISGPAPDGGSGGYSGGGGGGTSAASTSPAQAAANAQAIAIANSALGRLPNQLDVAFSNIRSQYGQQQNELQSARAQNQNTYNSQSTQNQQQRVTNNNQIDSQASGGLRGLLRVLGQRGAGGSAAARFRAPEVVGTQATQQRSGAAQTFGENQQNLDTNWNNFLTGFGNSERKLNDWRSEQENSARARGNQNKQTLLQTLASLQNSPGAAQPYIDQINSLAGEVDNLGRLNPTYSGVTPVYNAPELGSYAVAPEAAPTLQGGPQGGGSMNWLQMLMGRDREQRIGF